MVSAVPTACGGTDSVTRTLNCAESAITKKPQMSDTGTSSQSVLPNVKPMRSEHAPLAAIATVTSHSRPRRSATIPPQMQPRPPTAIAANAMADETEAFRVLVDASLAAMNTGSQVHAE